MRVPSVWSRRMQIGPDMTAGELHDALAARGAGAMVKALAALQDGTLDCQAQNDTDVQPMPPRSITRRRASPGRCPRKTCMTHIRGLAPHPGAWFELKQGDRAERVKVLGSVLADGSGVAGTLLDERLTVACGEGAVRLTKVQRAGKKPVTGEAFLRGTSLRKGTVIG